MSASAPNTDPFAPLPYGERGSPIEGSELYRNYCCVCGDPIRVLLSQRFWTHTCCRHCCHSPQRAADNLQHRPNSLS